MLGVDALARRRVLRLVILIVAMMLQLAVINGVEKDHSTNDYLKERSDSGTLRLHVLMLPSPKRTAENPGQCPRTLISAA
uniref:Putative secreted protein n=1 Tax=Anopheles darlingi TaxID=43151 RepID=A0A2M4D185_ANODA